MTKPFTFIATVLAFIGALHSYYSTQPAKTVEQYHKEQRTGLVKLNDPVRHTLRGIVFKEQGHEITCPTGSSFTRALISPWETQCD
jgi:hypothetical protein